ncbi:glyoxalase [Actinotalea sp. M2MS4P-6]|uniref:glyoxalase n=1 Tax=Actinotalea sp. M2MS4P-6 TaxID=2983762 RepID=UPI0021E35DD0|nr:glyoxalase [Actinotalea sp. M2MS4P-6]MCV2394001.1 glyoxalase [Actinotalea sp. M2MS4P-6]
MQVSFIAGFGPIARSVDDSHRFWVGALGLPLTELAPSYFHSEQVAGAKAFAIWSLDQAAESVFGTSTWPAEHPVPQAWLELDVATPAEVAEAVVELGSAGYQVLRGAAEEPWGQTTSRLLSPEGLLVGVSHTPWMHADAADSEEAPPAGSDS